MNFEKLVRSLDRFGRMLPAVVVDVSDADAKWKPENETWSILEIICHLADEETEDFRKRVQLTLDDPRTKGDRERCLESGMDEYLSKPIRIKEVEDMLAGIEPLDETQDTPSDANVN